MSKDRIVYDGIFETYYECEEHKVSYPKGANCPVCEHEEKKKDE